MTIQLQGAGRWQPGGKMLRETGVRY